MATIARVIYDVVARDGASRTFRHIGDDATFAEGRLARFGKAFAAVGGAAALAGAAVAAESIRMATSFQSSMTKIQTQAGASAADVRMLSGEVLRLASTRAQQGPQQLADALFHLKSVGLDNVHAMRALRTASDLAAVGGANLEQTTSAIGAAWRSGIKGAQNFGATAATVNAIIGAGNMRMGDFIDSLSSGILPAARTFGVSLKGVGAALALMTDEGIPAQLAATRLRMTLSLIGAPSSKAAAALKTIGLSSTSLAATMRGPGGLVAAVALLKSHLDASGLSATRQAQLISAAFGGGRSSAAIMTLLNNLNVLEIKQRQINATTSRYGAAVAAQRRTAEAQFARLRSIIDAAGVRIGLALLPPVTAFAGFLVNTALPDVGRFGHAVTTAFTSLIPVAAIKRDWHELMVWLGLEKPQIHPVRLTTADLLHLPGLAKVPLPLADVIHPVPLRLSTADLIHLPAPARLTAADLLHPLPERASVPMSVDLLHPRTAAHAGGITGMLTAAISGVNWGRITAALGAPLGRALGSAFGYVAQHAVVFAGQLTRALGSLDWVNIGKAVGGHAVGFALGFLSNLGADLFDPSFWQKHWWDAIIGASTVLAVGKLGGGIAKVLEHIPVLRWFAPLFRGLERITGPVTDRIWATAKAVGRSFLDGLRSVFPDTVAGLERFFSLLGTRIGVTAISIWDKARALGSGIGDGILRGVRGLGRIVGQVIRWILDPFRPAPRWLISSGRGAVGGLINGIREFFRPLTSVIGSVIGHIRAPFYAAGRWLVAAGRAVVGGLLNGIAAVARGVGGWIKAHLVDPIINAVKSFFGIHSPSAVMAGLGSHLMTGLFSGIMAHNPLNVVRKVFGSMPAALAHLVEKGFASIEALPGRALRALGSLGGKIGGFFGSLFGGGGGNPPGAGVARWGSTVLKVLGMLGLPRSYLGPWLTQIGTESGGNPRAINLTDINAKMGDPSRGVLQTIMSTFLAYAGPFRGLGIYNGLANIYAGINYALHRYGHTGMLSVIGHGHGYWQPGPITEPIFGIGASGRAYSFGENGLHERVVRDGGASSQETALLAQVNATLAKVLAAVQASPHQTGQAVGDAVTGVTGAALRRGMRTPR